MKNDLNLESGITIFQEIEDVIFQDASIILEKEIQKQIVESEEYADYLKTFI